VLSPRHRSTSLSPLRCQSRRKVGAGFLDPALAADRNARHAVPPGSRHLIPEQNAVVGDRRRRKLFEVEGLGARPEALRATLAGDGFKTDVVGRINHKVAATANQEVARVAMLAAPQERLRGVDPHQRGIRTVAPPENHGPAEVPTDGQTVQIAAWRVTQIKDDRHPAPRLKGIIGRRTQALRYAIGDVSSRGVSGARRQQGSRQR